MKFSIEKKVSSTLARAGRIETPHGVIETPAFVVVGTKATVKALTPEDVAGLGGQVVLGNTYHLYLQPGDEIVKKAGGLGKFMNWRGPTMTDSGGFQAFSLGAGFGERKSKIQKSKIKSQNDNSKLKSEIPLAKIDNDGVTFRSHLDGSEHRFTPERSIEIQHNLGADIIFVFDECTLPTASYEYQREAMGRTHEWAKRSLAAHKAPRQAQGENSSAIFGIVQGGRYEDLRKESARFVSNLDFDGFGIGGSFEKEDIGTAVRWVNEILPEGKPRHLLGIGEPEDLIEAIKNGCDLFDCVAPTRMARNGTLYTSAGKINIENAKFREDFSPVDENCGCYTCQNYTKAYLAHLFRAEELLVYRLASIHNLYYIVNFVKKIREKILDQNNEF